MAEPQDDTKTGAPGGEDGAEPDPEEAAELELAGAPPAVTVAAEVEAESEAEVETPPRAALVKAPARGGLAGYDPLRAYMAEVARHPLLSREEEHALALRFRDTGDVQAAYRLVAANLRLVVKIAHEYRRTAFQLLDLVQEGNLGLMQAVKKYDPMKGVKLSSYAAWWIRAYIIRFIMENWRLVKLGTTQAQRKLFFNLSKERERLLARGIDPTPQLLAHNLDVEEQDIQEMTARMAADDLSLDAPVHAGDEGDQGSRMDRMPAEGGVGAEAALGDRELQALFREKLTAFAATISDEKELFIYQRRLMPPEGEEPLTLQEIGDRYRLTRERARQIEARLTKRLREYLRTEIPDFELLGPPGDPQD